MDGRRIQERGFGGPTASAASAVGLPPPPPLASLQEDQDHRCTGRVRMRRWLMTQVMSGRYNGLKWIDREKTLLRIPWKHGSRSGWSAEDGKLFESWAIQSGKFDPHHPNARKWKANFRCALRSLPDVEEVKNLSHKTGKDAYKIFRFLPEKQRKRCYKRQQHVNAMEDCSPKMVMRRHDELELNCGSAAPTCLHGKQSARIADQVDLKLEHSPDGCQGIPTRSSWRQTYSSRSLMKTEVFVRPEIPALTRVPTNNLGITDGVTDRKLTPGEMLHCPGSREDHHRRMCFPSPSSSSLETSDRTSPSRYWHPPPPLPSSMSFCRAPDALNPSSIGGDLQAWSMRAHQPPLPGSHPPSSVFPVAPFNDFPCDQYPNSFASPALATDPPLHGGGSFRGMGAYMPMSDSYAFNSDLYNAGTGEFNDMAAYPAAQCFEEMPPAQPEMTDISNIANVHQWTANGAQEMAEFWDVMQAVLRDKGSLGNDIQYNDDLEQFAGKPGHP